MRDEGSCLNLTAILIPWWKIEGAEFPAESAFEKIPVPSRLPKIFIFPRPYSLFPTRHRNFFQIRARQGKLTEDRTCENSNHVQYFRWLLCAQPSTDKLLHSWNPTVPATEHLQLISPYLTTWWATLHRTLLQRLFKENAVLSTTVPREAQPLSAHHPNLVHQVLSAHGLTTDSIAIAVDVSRIVVVWVLISREWWWVMKIVL